MMFNPNGLGKFFLHLIVSRRSFKIAKNKLFLFLGKYELLRDV